MKAKERDFLDEKCKEHLSEKNHVLTTEIRHPVKMSVISSQQLIVHDTVQIMHPDGDQTLGQVVIKRHLPNSTVGVSRPMPKLLQPLLPNKMVNSVKVSSLDQGPDPVIDVEVLDTSSSSEDSCGYTKVNIDEIRDQFIQKYMDKIHRPSDEVKSRETAQNGHCMVSLFHSTDSEVYCGTEEDYNGVTSSHSKAFTVNNIKNQQVYAGMEGKVMEGPFNNSFKGPYGKGLVHGFLQGVTSNGIPNTSSQPGQVFQSGSPLVRRTKKLSYTVSLPPSSNTGCVTSTSEQHQKQTLPHTSSSTPASPLTKYVQMIPPFKMPVVHSSNGSPSVSNKCKKPNLHLAVATDISAQVARRHKSSASSASSVSPGALSVSSQASELSGMSYHSDISSDSQGQASLLDSLHKKYYPDQYKNRSAVQSPLLQRANSHQEAGRLQNGRDSISQGSKSGSATDLCDHDEVPGDKAVGDDESTTTTVTEHDSEETVDEVMINNPILLEIEAYEACRWLKAAGFPQYVQMYIDHEFPIDTEQITKDHMFLDKDALESLFRRIKVLNSCAAMKLDTQQRKQSDDSDEEDECALSSKWQFQRSSRRWSRLELDLSGSPELAEVKPTAQTAQPEDPLDVSISRDSLLTDTSEISPAAVAAASIFSDMKPINLFDNRDRSSPRTVILRSSSSNGSTGSQPSSTKDLIPPTSPYLRRVASEKLGPKNFLKRLESLKKSKKPVLKDPVEIGAPVVINTDAMNERMRLLGCQDIPKINDQNVAGVNHRTGSFTLGHHNQTVGEVRAASEDRESRPLASTSHKRATSEDRLMVRTMMVESRMSVYDNCSPPPLEAHLQKELDDILKDLMGLNESLIKEDSVLQLGTFGLQKYDPQRPPLAQAEDVDSISLHNDHHSTNQSPMKSFHNTNIHATAFDSGRMYARLHTIESLDDPVNEYSSHAVESSEEEEEEDEEEAQSSASSHHESDTARDEDGSDRAEEGLGRERRDSGVGSSLTRAPSDRRRQRIRWHSFIKSHRTSLNSSNLQINNLTIGQLMVIRKMCLLRVTSLMEKYSPSHRSGWNWAMPKFMRRLKTPDFKGKLVFGIPPLVIQQRTGLPLPQCLLFAMRCLRRTAADSVGIFRKSGVKSRITKLRDQLEADPSSVDFENLQPYDVADLIKQYFRELPECLLTNKLSETFLSIFMYVPEDERLCALQYTVMLLPDENREVLQSLLLFLADIASHSHKNQMTEHNLAVCFAPCLFHIYAGSSSPKRSKQGAPDPREMQMQTATITCLTNMIKECSRIFSIPSDLLKGCTFTYIEQGDPVPLDELGLKSGEASDSGGPGYIAYIDYCIQGLLKESRDKFKGWLSVGSHAGVDMSYKKVQDGHPLKLWRTCVEVEAPPVEVLNWVLRERHRWDEDLLKFRVVQRLDNQTEVFSTVISSLAPHPSREYCELRSWRNELPRGACILVSTSVEHAESPLDGGIRGVVLASRFLMEPCGAGKCRVTHICRVDMRGHSPEWYSKVYGHICAINLAHIRDTCNKHPYSADGPETKI